MKRQTMPNGCSLNVDLKGMIMIIKWMIEWMDGWMTIKSWINDDHHWKGGGDKAERNGRPPDWKTESKWNIPVIMWR